MSTGLKLLIMGTGPREVHTQLDESGQEMKNRIGMISKIGVGMVRKMGIGVVSGKRG